MRKLILLFLMVGILVFPSLAAAQSDLSFETFQIQLWPEYDRPEMLVMYSFTFPEGTSLPADVKIRVPPNAALNAVAKVSNDTLLTVPYDTPVREGDWMVITFQADELTSYRVEYYTPIEKNGRTRQYSFVWEGDYDIAQLFVDLQEPTSATALETTPELTESREQSGIRYRGRSFGQFAAGETLTLDIAYEKDNDNLTVSSMPVEVSGTSGTEEESASSFSSGNLLPGILVGLGILLVAGGILYFFLSGRKEGISNKPSRKRHKPQPSAGRYCHECGSRASANDKFCRSCGAKLRK